MTAIAPTTFRVDVPDSVLADLRERLARTRFPDQAPGAPWAYGADLGYVKDLCEYWRERYDWRKHEAALNGFRQFTARVAGIDLHFIHEEGRGPKPLPLLLSHGWPGSIWEFHKIIPMLTDPARFGGDPADAFTVVAPSLPGYGFSFAPGQARFGITEIADAFAVLMTDVLSYRRFAAQGGDWGGFITSRLGVAYPERLAGIHVNLLSLRRDLPRPKDKDVLLTNITLYWVTGAINSSFWPYYARYHAPWPIADGQRVEVPTAYAAFPKEIVRPPRSWAERVYNIRRWTVMPSGGHFAALEEPQALVDDLRAFFRDLR